MKKVLSIILVVSFILGSAVLLPAMAEEGDASTTVQSDESGSSLEKILSPDQIRFFRNIVKKGTALFGIKKERKAEKKETAASGQELEKITAPQYISLYEKIRRVGNALWGYKKMNGEENKKPYHVITSESVSCVTAAIETKDAAIISANTNFTTELNSAISARTACQKTALETTEGQEEAIMNCNKTFKESFKQSRKNAAEALKNARKIYTDSLKTCVSSETAATSTEETATEVTIEDGGGSVTEAATE